MTFRQLPSCMVISYENYVIAWSIVEIFWPDWRVARRADRFDCHLWPKVGLSNRKEKTKSF